jgi:hypothetical protein
LMSTGQFSLFFFWKHNSLLMLAKLSMSEIVAIINEFRSHHLSELTEVCNYQHQSFAPYNLLLYVWFLCRERKEHGQN